MEFHGIPISSIWPAIKWLPGATLKRFFPKERLSALQYVDLVPRGDSSTINLGEYATFDAWLNIINLSPFTVEFDRGEFVFWFGGASIKTTRAKKELIEPGRTMRFQISESLSDGVAKQIARNYRSNADLRASLTGFIEFNCRLHPFCRNIHDLTDIRPRLLNDQLCQD
jgi:hypothetical protein